MRKPHKEFVRDEEGRIKYLNCQCYRKKKHDWSELKEWGKVIGIILVFIAFDSMLIESFFSVIGA